MQPAENGLKLYTSSEQAMWMKKTIRVICVCVVSLCVAALLLPGMQESLKVVCNSLFAASEAANTYVYERLDTAADASAAPAHALLGIAAVALCALAASARGGLPVLLLLPGVVGGQVYLGLSFPAWLNGLVFSLAGLLFLRRAGTRCRLVYLACVLALALAMLAISPGVNTEVEAASERVRDQLSIAAQRFSQALTEIPPDVLETRHENRRDLQSGDGAAQSMREYRLITKTEMQIAMPQWVNVLKTMVVSLLSIALLIVPFLPFLLVNRRKKRVMQRRASFESDDLPKAVRAIFGHVIAYLDAVCNTPENLPFSAWKDEVFLQISQDYACEFAAAVPLWREAKYSEHVITEAQRDQMLELLSKTERLLFDGADWKTKLKLKYQYCLHE